MAALMPTYTFFLLPQAPIKKPTPLLSETLFCALSLESMNCFSPNQRFHIYKLARQVSIVYNSQILTDTKMISIE